MFRTAWLLTLIVVITTSLLPAQSSPIQMLGTLHLNDKVEHFAAYFALSVLSLLSFSRRRTGIFVALGMIALGAALELGQHLSPGRTPDFRDGLANALGVLSGLVIWGPLRALKITPAYTTRS